MISPADLVQIPLDDWVNSFVRDFLVPNFGRSSGPCRRR